MIDMVLVLMITYYYHDHYSTNISFDVPEVRWLHALFSNIRDTRGYVRIVLQAGAVSISKDQLLRISSNF